MRERYPVGVLALSMALTSWPLLGRDSVDPASFPIAEQSGQLSSYVDSGQRSETGRGRDWQNNTLVLELYRPAALRGAQGSQEPRWSRPVVSDIRRDLYDPALKKPYLVQLSLESRVEFAAERKRYVYSYKVASESDSPLRIEWEALEHSAFGAAARDFFDRHIVKREIPLTWSQESSISPTLDKRYVKIYLSGNFDRHVTGAWAPAYVPAIN